MVIYSWWDYMAASPIISLSLFQPHLSPSALWTYQMYSNLKAFALPVPAAWNALPPAVCTATPWPPPDMPTNVPFPARVSSSKSCHPSPNSPVPPFLLLSLYGTNHCLTSLIWFMYVVYCLPPPQPEGELHEAGIVCPLSCCNLSA